MLIWYLMKLVSLFGNMWQGYNEYNSNPMKIICQVNDINYTCMCTYTMMLYIHS